MKKNALVAALISLFAVGSWAQAGGMPADPAPMGAPTPASAPHQAGKAHKHAHKKAHKHGHKKAHKKGHAHAHAASAVQ